MSQTTSGWRAVLSLPRIYGFSQNLLGGARFYRILVRDYIRPFPGCSILDLGCGHAPVLEYLPPDIRYVGIDPSLKYIRAAEKRFGPRGEFRCLAVEDLSAAGPSGFDIVLGLGVLHHLNRVQAERFFALAAASLHGTGRCLTVDPCVVENQHPLAGFLIRLDRGGNIRSPEGYAALARSAFSRLEQNILRCALRLPYTHHVLECRK